ncbi:MAG TPA: LytR C-terminal domain-containing protein [Solirubrobacteraceae bacterium]|nr:LytR C-terminal domain-containing protein [Solirubrobacteraceae bacterium]
MASRSASADALDEGVSARRGGEESRAERAAVSAGRARDVALKQGGGPRGTRGHPGSASRRGEPSRANGLAPRTIAMIAGAAVVAVLVVMIATGVFSGGGSSSTATSGSSATASATSHAKRASAKKPSPHSPAAIPGAASPSAINVVVLNGTETAMLAHHFASKLTQLGYSKATALGGRPEGTNQVTVVDYASGHRADAESVARALAISTVQPIESSASALAGSANVVVIVGLDRASSGP